MYYLYYYSACKSKWTTKAFRHLADAKLWQKCIGGQIKNFA